MRVNGFLRKRHLWWFPNSEVGMGSDFDNLIFAPVGCGLLHDRRELAGLTLQWSGRPKRQRFGRRSPPALDFREEKASQGGSEP